MRRGFSLRYGSIKGAKCGVAARESAGIPCRYLPVNAPRPSGDQAMKPLFKLIAQSSASPSTLRSSNENSFCSEVIGAFAELASCSEIARALCQPLKLEIPTYRARPLV